MSVLYIDYPNKEAWLKGRINSLGASEVASVLGIGFLSQDALWDIKTGKVEPADLSFNDRVRYGTEAEACLRALFALKNKDKYLMEYNPYRVYNNERHPFLTATLDGELTRLSDNKKGVWECKTVWINSSKMLEEWKGKIPDKYYCQVCEQLAITERSFAVVTAELIFPDGESEIHNYTIDRTEQVERDIKFVYESAVDWWLKYVVTQKKPPVKMTL